MLDIQFIRDNPQKVIENLKARGANISVETLLRLDKERRKLIKEIDTLRAEKNTLSSEKIPHTTQTVRQQFIKKSKNIGSRLKKLESKFTHISKQYDELMNLLPNMMLKDVPIGHDESHHQLIRSQPPEVKDFPQRNYIDLGESLRLFDTKRASKVSGSRFAYLSNEAVWLEFALISYALKTLTNHKFIPMLPPVLINHDSMQSMGYLEHGQDREIYFFPKDNLYLVGTSEQSIGPFHKNESISYEELPLRYVGFSTCFRREAGSYGKDTKGILRMHQFDKLEMFSFTSAEQSEKEHEFLLSIQENLVKSLRLPYRILNMCSGDLGAPAAKRYDIECWLPSENRFRETHSTSNCTDWQARRLHTYYKDKSGKKKLVHTLNGTYVAIGRILIMIMEHYQNKNGEIEVPEILKPYVPFKTIKPKQRIYH